MSVNSPGLDAANNERAAALDAILTSASTSRLIVAGPGTGKTYTFKQLIASTGQPALVLTFINNLVQDLARDLGQTADVVTLHAFCNRLRVTLPIPDQRSRYYAHLGEIIAEDLRVLGLTGLSAKDVGKALRASYHNMATGDPLLIEALRVGTYYAAVSHEDVVYRVVEYLTNNSARIPHSPLIIVDEYQDFSLLEAQLIHLLSESNSLVIAGDDDQALYEFKHASASYIRTLASNGKWHVYSLPYCSRCTKVIVEAHADVIRQATARGLLLDRIDKPFRYYPGKSADSEQYPVIIHAKCTVETNRIRYMCRYVHAALAAIPSDDIAGSWAAHYPTALVIGPSHFVDRVARYLIDQSVPNVEERKTHEGVSILDGYQLILSDPRSNLGWRIVLHCDPYAAIPSDLRRVLLAESPIIDSLPSTFTQPHLQIVSHLRSLADGETLTDDVLLLLQQTMGPAIDKFVLSLEEPAAAEAPSVDTTAPRVVCATLIGSKGLQADHVFMVGIHNGTLPRNAAAITDPDVCEFLVALTRTKRQCHIVTCDRFGDADCRPSVFLSWIDRGRLRVIKVNSAYWARANQ